MSLTFGSSFIKSTTRDDTSTFCQEKPKTSQQKGASVPEGENVSVNKEDEDSNRESLEEEMVGGVGEAAPLVAVSPKDEVQKFLLVGQVLQTLFAQMNTVASIPREGSRSISMSGSLLLLKFKD